MLPFPQQPPCRWSPDAMLLCGWPGSMPVWGGCEQVPMPWVMVTQQFSATSSFKLHCCSGSAWIMPCIPCPRWAQEWAAISEKCFPGQAEGEGGGSGTFPSLTLTHVLLFALQGRATSAGPTTARAGARRPPCSCAPGSLASRARSRSNTPTEQPRAWALPGSPRPDGQPRRTRNFQVLPLRSGTNRQPQGGREAKGGAKPPGQAGQGQALSPKPA